MNSIDLKKDIVDSLENESRIEAELLLYRAALAAARERTRRLLRQAVALAKEDRQEVTVTDRKAFYRIIQSPSKN